MPRRTPRTRRAKLQTTIRMPSRAEFHRQYVAAGKAAALARRTKPRIVSAKCAARRRSLEVAFTNGVTILIPLDWFAALRHATRQQINRCEVDEGGAGLHWEALDADYSAETL